MKKSIKIVLATLLILVIFFSVKHLIKSNVGTLDTYLSINLKLNKLLNPESINNKSIKKIRENLNTQSTKWSKKPIPFSNIKNITISENSKKIPIRIYTPDSSSSLPIVIYSHGGFWVAGNLDAYDTVCRKLSKNSKTILISVDYHLAPENPFPIAVEDIYDILNWTYKNADNINGDKKHIAIAGDSSGGNLSAAVSLMTRDKNGPPITCQVLIYPSTNIFKLNSNSWSLFANSINLSIKDMEKYISLYVPKKEDRKSPYTSPLLSENLRKLPDTLIITAEIDPLRDEGESYGNKLKEAGNNVTITQYKGVCHGFITMDKITNKADNAINQISLYLQKKFKTTE